VDKSAGDFHLRGESYQQKKRYIRCKEEENPHETNAVHPADAHACACAALAEEEDEPVTPMHDLTMAHGFRFGGALSYMQLWDANYLNFLKTHCNSITATNEMKAYSLLDQSKSRAQRRYAAHEF